MIVSLSPSQSRSTMSSSDGSVKNAPAASTVATWKGFVKSFVSPLGEDMSRVTSEGVIAWKDALVSQGYSPEKPSGWPTGGYQGSI